MKLDIQNMSDNELVSLRDRLTEEIVTRKDRLREKMWQAMAEAITEYVKRFGTIVITTHEDDIYIGDSCTDFSTIGEISICDW